MQNPVAARPVAGSHFDLGLLVAFGAVGYLMKTLDYPIAPLVLAMVLGDRTEDTFRQSMLLSGGKLSVFFASTLAATISSLAIQCLAVPLVGFVRRSRRPQPT